MIYQFLTIPGNSGSVNVNNPTVALGSINNIVSGLFYIVINLVGFLMAIWMFWGVYEYIFAGGDKDKIGKARKRITYAIIGFLIVILSYTLSAFIKDILSPNTIGNVKTVSTP